MATKQIKTWVANTWVKLLQTTGQSTNKAMSQKAVTDSLDSLKSDLGGKINYTDSLSLEEIMANNIDLTNKIASANALKEIATLNLLWENASPTSSFEKQNISLDLSGYKMVYIRLRFLNNADEAASFVLIPIGEKIGFCTAYNNNSLVMVRKIEVYDNYILFHSGILNGITDDNIAIPNKIYGIK